MTEAQTAAACPRCGGEDRDGRLCRVCSRHLFGALRSVLPRIPDPTTAPIRVKAAPVGFPTRQKVTTYIWPRGTVGRNQTLPWENRSEAWIGLARELEVSLTRQGNRGSGVGGRGSDTPVPFDDGARDALDHLRAVLSTWCRELHYVSEDWPEDTLESITEWLLERRERIRAHDAADEIYGDITGAIRGGQWVIDTRMARTFVGPCPICGKGDVYAGTNDESGVCRACAKVIPGIPEMRKRNDAAVKATYVTRREVLPALLDIYGLTIKDGTLKKWIQRGRLVSGAVRITDQEPLYLVGEVLELASSLRAQQVSEAAQTKHVKRMPVAMPKARETITTMEASR